MGLGPTHGEREVADGGIKFEGSVGSFRVMEGMGKGMLSCEHSEGKGLMV